MHTPTPPALAAGSPLLEGDGLAIGIVQARFNNHITDAMAATCQTELLRLGVALKKIELIQVPGALEIPVVLQDLAEKESFDALIAIGCVIRGETYHFELVAQTSAQGIGRLVLDYQIPIINAILTTETTDQAQARSLGKSVQAAQDAVEMANMLER